ncbi:MAG: hypothetical protein AABW89_01800 [Nanoarchaeota archaeon]
MVNWIFILLVIIAVFIFFKITSFRYERWWTYSIAILLIFVLFSFFNVVRSNDIDLNSLEGFVSAVKAYTYWVVNFGQTASSITGKAGFFDWNATKNASTGK